MARSPEIAVAVPSHDRPLRLRWLLNALEDQTLARERWEVVVAHDSSGPETEALLRDHPLAVDGTLRHVRLAPGSAPPGRNRNAAWRKTSAPLIAFTDDDCRPPPEWLERALASAEAHPGAIVQGSTRTDPHEDAIGRAAPRVATQHIWPPKVTAEACNIVYPRPVLEAHGGFDEAMFVGEDTDLAERARAAGTAYVGATEVENWHAVHELTFAGALRGAWRWRGMPELVKRHPRLREEFVLWIFWKREHLWLVPALAGAALARRNAAWAAMALPYVIHAAPRHHGSHPRGRIRSAMEMPARTAIDAVELAALAWGSIRHRSLFL